VVVIDAGHGGEDPGASSSAGVLEKDVNLQIAGKVGCLLTEKGFTVVYTRTEDKLLYTEQQNVKGLRKINDLKNRCKIANSYEDSIFISVHCNSFSMPKYSGLQVYYSREEGSYSLASSIQERVRTELQPENNRKVKEGKGIYLMENIRTTAVLIECGFLSNEEERNKLLDEEYQNKLAFIIANSIIEYINL
jgi:N-acetylmuramoyl-L-alanine amidase